MLRKTKVRINIIFETKQTCS